jgi:hypothetical protein
MYQHILPGMQAIQRSRLSLSAAKRRHERS